MKREIKFRAWDKDFATMVYEFTEDGYSVDMQNGELVVGSNDGNGDYFELDLMQFTGLLDKNGKEIYTCDILRAIQEDHESPWPEYSDNLVKSTEVRYVVEDAESYYLFKGIPSDQYYAYHNIKSPEYRRWEYDGKIKTEAYYSHRDFGKRDYMRYVDFEVIGNIYENPELLNK